MTAVYIFANSPGEIYAFVRPFVQTLHTELKGRVIIFVFLTPCQYATGEELRVCQGFDGITHVFPPKKTLSHVFSTNLKPGIVVYLGGDPFYSRRFAKKTSSLLIGYTENPIAPRQFELLIQKSPKVDLMKSGLSDNMPLSPDGIVLMPGSRPEHLAVALPLMLRLTESCPFQRTIGLSPFTPDSVYKRIHAQYPDVSVQIITDPNGLKAFKYALTIPGTNTMQLAYLGIPYIMILPTHNPDILRMNGLYGWLIQMPVIGRPLKRLTISILLRKNRHYSIPNQFFGESVCPEFVGPFDVDTVSQRIYDFVTDSDAYDTIIDRFHSLKSVKSPLSNLIKFIDVHAII